MSAWFVYLLRCADGTLYTGITTDVDRRLAEHNADNALGARYTRSRRPVELVYVEAAESRSAAAKREAALRKLGRGRKLALACTCDPAHTGLNSLPTPTLPINGEGAFSPPAGRKPPSPACVGGREGLQPRPASAPSPTCGGGREGEPP